MNYEKTILMVLVVVMLFSLFNTGLPYYNAISKKTVDGSDNTIVYTENFEEYADISALKTALANNWNIVRPSGAQYDNNHQLITDPYNVDNNVLYMNSFSGLMWKEALNKYEFSTDIKISATNSGSTTGTRSAFLIRVNRDSMNGKGVYEGYPGDGDPLGTSGIIVYLWQTSMNIRVKTYDETGAIGNVDFGNVRIPNSKDVRNNYVNLKVVDDGEGVIKIYLDNILIVTFTLSEKKEISDGTRTAIFYTKLKAVFNTSQINFWDNKGITELNNVFVSASNGTLSYATRANAGTLDMLIT